MASAVALQRRACQGLNNDRMARALERGLLEQWSSGARAEL